MHLSINPIQLNLPIIAALQAIPDLRHYIHQRCSLLSYQPHLVQQAAFLLRTPSVGPKHGQKRGTFRRLTPFNPRWNALQAASCSCLARATADTTRPLQPMRRCLHLVGGMGHNCQLLPWTAPFECHCIVPLQRPSCRWFAPDLHSVSLIIFG